MTDFHGEVKGLSAETSRGGVIFTPSVVFERKHIPLAFETWPSARKSKHATLVI